MWGGLPDPGLTLPAELSHVLSDEELGHANKFVFEEDRRRFIISHGLLRHVLAYYGNILPAEICFSLSKYGKPYIPGAVAFNMSHSGAGGIVALIAEGAVGTDIEAVQSVFAADSLARRFFSPDEQCAYDLVAEDQKARSFLSIWTRKEAYIKALGGGLALPLNKFSVSLVHPARLMRGLNDDTTAWRIFHLDPDEKHIGAVVVPATVERMTYVSIVF